jgi:hydrogenase maturation protease
MHLVRDPLPGPASGGPVVTAPREVRLLVCGTADRGDDGAALAAVAGLLPGLPPHLLTLLEVRRCEQLEIDDLVDLPDGMACVIVDAVVGVPPGEVVTLPVSSLPEVDTAAGPTPRSSHALPIGQLVALAEVLRGRALEGSFVGIGGRSFGYGRAVGRTVRAGLPAFRAAIEAALIRHSAHAHID